jgi:hypothetical protein
MKFIFKEEGYSIFYRSRERDEDNRYYRFVQSYTSLIT